MSRVIALLPIGAVLTEHVNLVAPYVTKTFAARVVVAPAMPLPSNTRDPRRDQYRARAIVDTLIEHL